MVVLSVPLWAATRKWPNEEYYFGKAKHTALAQCFSSQMMLSETTHNKSAKRPIIFCVA